MFKVKFTPQRRAKNAHGHSSGDKLRRKAMLRTIGLRGRRGLVVVGGRIVR